MNLSDILDNLQQQFPDAGLELDDTQPEPLIKVPAENIAKVAEHLRDHSDLRFDCLMCLSGLDWGEELHTVYHLYSMQHDHKIALRCVVPKDDPVIPTVSFVWRTADWHERESYDLVGIHYKNHPDHRRILCPYDWEGHPLRKDYVPQEKWHNIPLTNLMPESPSDGGES